MKMNFTYISILKTFQISDQFYIKFVQTLYLNCSFSLSLVSFPDSVFLYKLKAILCSKKRKKIALLNPLLADHKFTSNEFVGEALFSG